ncbi:HAMP domain-containing histidine kinase [Patescibacteria group bacterium AH-259-L05]|nr:HAMP domain-containing histidine kinase [Patescibacteria group bacterium AH-259-L05]
MKQSDIITGLQKRTVVSWLSMFFVLAILLFLAPMGLIFSWQMVILFLASAAALNLLFSWFVKKNIFIESSTWLWPFSEIWIISLIVYYTGGFASVFSFLYLVPIITSALLFSLSAGLSMAVLSSLAYLSLTMMELYEIIPHISSLGVRILTWDDNFYIAFSVLLNRILIFFAVAYFGGYLSGKQRAVERMKSEFVFLASHQLRTPITAIRLFVEMLRDSAKEELSDQNKRYLENIYHSTKRMIQLVGDLLNVSRIESDRLTIRPQMTRLEGLVADVIEETKPLADVKGCRFKFSRPEARLDKVLIDPRLLRQILHNLITNAIHYSRQEGGDIVICLERGKKDYTISVKDFGVGISNADKNRIFEKFFRADNAIKLKPEGTGLGLYIVKTLITTLGGKIWFESELNKGTTFYIVIPKNNKSK